MTGNKLHCRKMYLHLDKYWLEGTSLGGRYASRWIHEGQEARWQGMMPSQSQKGNKAKKSTEMNALLKSMKKVEDLTMNSLRTTPKGRP
jgi:hypothetical protein